MQKIAVALTTQEEFNEYMEWREKNNLKVYAVGQLFTKAMKEQKVCVDCYNGNWDFIEYYELNGYKIISLKEAIGEKENKEEIIAGNFEEGHIITKQTMTREAYNEKYGRMYGYIPEKQDIVDKKIIREGEARGLEPKKVRLIKLLAGYPIGEYTTNDDGYYIYEGAEYFAIHKDIVNGMKEYFESIEEPKTDWISNMKDDLKSESKVICADFGDGIVEAVPFEYLREAIEKHIPCVSNEEVNKAIEEGGDMPRTSIKLLLKSKGLLE